MALGRDDVRYLQTKCEELVSNQVEIKDCEFSFGWVMERLGDWATDTDVGEDVKSACQVHYDVLKSLIEETDAMIDQLRAFLENQTLINASTTNV